MLRWLQPAPTPTTHSWEKMFWRHLHRKRWTLERQGGGHTPQWACSSSATKYEPHKLHADFVTASCYEEAHLAGSMELVLLFCTKHNTKQDGTRCTSQVQLNNRHSYFSSMLPRYCTTVFQWILFVLWLSWSQCCLWTSNSFTSTSGVTCLCFATYSACPIYGRCFTTQVLMQSLVPGSYLRSWANPPCCFSLHSVLQTCLGIWNSLNNYLHSCFVYHLLKAPQLWV